MKWLAVGGCRLPGTPDRGSIPIPANRQPPTGNRHHYFVVIHTSFENSRSFGSAARASTSESNRTRTR